MVCYDLRFPELALTLRAQNAQILTAPAAFTYTTGQMHWQLLLQARAMDTQCHVLGAAQQGGMVKNVKLGDTLLRRIVADTSWILFKTMVLD